MATAERIGVAVGTAPSAQEQKRLRGEHKLRRELGPVVLEALLNDRTEDVCLNPDGRLWVNELGSGWRCVGLIEPATALTAMGTIAAERDTVITADRPILETELPIDGSRFEGLVPPVVTAPAFAIRTRAKRVFPIEQYEEAGILTSKEDPRNRFQARRSFQDLTTGMSHAEVIKAAIKNRKNILIVGSTGSGKTTLVNACLELIHRYTPGDRVVSIEDTMELQSPVANGVDLRAVGGVTMQECLRATMRMKPKRIVVGEVRGSEALVMLKAWNTGHPGGVATVHANDALSGLIRLESLVAEGTVSPQPALIGEAVDVVVFIDEDADIAAGRKVREVMLVEKYKDGEYLCQYV